MMGSSNNIMSTNSKSTTHTCIDKQVTIIAGAFDKSGSVEKYQDLYISGTNEFLSQQRRQATKNDIDIRFNCLMFNDEMDWVIPPGSNGLVEFPDIRSFPDFNKSTYFCESMTALNDAIVKTIAAVDKYIERKLTKQQHKVIIVVKTDGLDNSSDPENTVNKIRKLISDRQKMGWEFIFLAAGQDAITTGKQYGIGSKSSLTYQQKLTPIAYRKMSEAVTRCITAGDEIAFTPAERSTTMSEISALETTACFNPFSTLPKQENDD